MCESVIYKSFVATDQGRREYMEDFVCMSRQQQNETKRKENFAVKCKENMIEYFAVFDGHGGSDAAYFAQHNLLGEITKQTGFWSQDRRSVSNSITEGFISTTKAMWNVFGEWLMVTLCVFLCAQLIDYAAVNQWLPDVCASCFGRWLPVNSKCWAYSD